MCNLIKVEENLFAIHNENRYLIGSKADALVYMTSALNANPKEVLAAFSELDARGDNCANFGINMMLIFTNKVDVPAHFLGGC